MVCGDGSIDAPEECDDGDTSSGDGCSASCAEESGWNCTGEPSVCTTTCGDNIVAGAEACDDGNTVVTACVYGVTSPYTQVCSADCTDATVDCSNPQYCGDSTVQSGAGEACDDGNTTVTACVYGDAPPLTQVCAADCTDATVDCDAPTYCGDCES